MVSDQIESNLLQSVALLFDLVSPCATESMHHKSMIVIPILRPNKEHQHAQRRKREGKEKSTKAVNRIKKLPRILLSPIQNVATACIPHKSQKFIEMAGPSPRKTPCRPHSVHEAEPHLINRGSMRGHAYIALSPRRHGSHRTSLAATLSSSSHRRSMRSPSERFR